MPRIRGRNGKAEPVYRQDAKSAKKNCLSRHVSGDQDIQRFSIMYLLKLLNLPFLALLAPWR
jgi:hypothetical protein